MEQSQINSLLEPAVYPEETATVKHLQTHISHIFLTDRYVYKIKKPVDFGFLDFTTLEKRRHYCNEELRLNRRLSPDIYLDVVELRKNGADGICFGGDGAVLEYAVKMKRLPENRMMSYLLERNQVTEAEIDLIAATVARFHAEAANDNGIKQFGTVKAISDNWQENISQTRAYCQRTISEDDLDCISNCVRKRIEHDRQLLEQRAREGFIRECDGDLHSENICLDEKVHIFDCIEFSEKFRYSDTAADIAFLAMDLENHGRQDLAERFVQKYQLLTDDFGMQQILPLYLANRAFIRGKVESFRLDDPQIDEAEKQAASERAKRFFRLARGYLLRELLPATLFLTCGPTGSGKSILAAELAFQLGVRHISSDIERKRLAGISPSDHIADIYSDKWNSATYQRLLKLSEELFSVGRGVIVDATFRRRSDREAFVRMAEKSGIRVMILLLSVPPDIVRERLEKRRYCNDVVSDGTWQVYQQQTASFELPDRSEAMLLDLDATLSPFDLVDHILDTSGLLPTGQEKKLRPAFF